jgi:hypothetical protein
MAKGKGKKATSGDRNSDRPNGKAWKKSTAAAIKAGTFAPGRKNG